MNQIYRPRAGKNGSDTTSYATIRLFRENGSHLSVNEKSGEHSCCEDVAVISPVDGEQNDSHLPFRELPCLPGPPRPQTKPKRPASNSFSCFGLGNRVRRASSTVRSIITPSMAKHSREKKTIDGLEVKPTATLVRSPTRSGFLRRPKTASSPAEVYGAPELPRYDSLTAKDSRCQLRDSSRGAAARQFARDFGKFGPHTPISRHDSGTFHSTQNDEVSLDDSAIGSSRDSSLTRAKRQKIDLKDPLTVLPTELASLILSFLPPSSLIEAELVSREWHRLASDPLIWRNAFYSAFGYPRMANEFPVACGGHGLGKLNHDPTQPWKKMLKTRHAVEKNWQKGTATARYLYGHTDSVYCVQFDEDKIITGSRDRTIRIWDTRTGVLRLVIGAPTVRISDEKHHASLASRDPVTEHIPPQVEMPGITILPRQSVDFSTPGLYHVPKYYHRASILCLQYDSTQLVTGSSDNSLIVWDIATWEPLRRLEQHKSGVLDIAFDASKIVSCSKDGSICIWARDSATLLCQISGHRGPVNAVQLRGDLIVSASGEGCAKLWQLTMPNDGQLNHAGAITARCTRDFWSRDRGLACVECSPTGDSILAGGNDHVIYKFSVSPAPLQTSEGHGSSAFQLQSHLQRETIQMRGHTSLVRSLYLDHANKRIISGSYDLSMRVWDFETGREIVKLEGWASSWGLAAKGDWRRVVGASQDGRVGVVDFGGDVRGVDALDG